MASINLNNLKGSDKTSIDKRSKEANKETYVYKDIDMDLKIGFVNTNKIANINEITADIKTINDIKAIVQSIKNILNTIPGQKLLNPYLGIDLRKFLFDPVTENTSEEIARTIINGLPRQEPRIILNNISVNGYADEQKYEIQFAITIPYLNNNRVTFNGVLNSDGFK